MKSFFKFIIIFSSILLLSAFLAPILFEFLPFKFERIFNRLVMIFTLAAILAFVRLRRDMLVKYQLIWTPQSLHFFSRAFGVSFIILIVATAFQIGLGAAKWIPQHFTIWSLLYRVGYSLGAALLIGVIEEFFFRGYIFQTIRDRFRWGLVGALVTTNIFYSLIHFVSKRKPYIGPEPTFFDSLTLMKAPFMSFLEWQTLWPAAIGLLIFGFVLNFLVLRTGSLYPAIGMHAGCVFFIKMDGLFVDFLGKEPLLYGSKKVYDGVLGWGFIVLLGILLLWSFRGDKVSHESL